MAITPHTIVKKRSYWIVLMILMLFFAGCQRRQEGPSEQTPTIEPKETTTFMEPVETQTLPENKEDQEHYSVTSPDGDIQVDLTMMDGTPHYQIYYAGKAVLLPSRLGFRFQDDVPFEGNLSVASSESSTFDEMWTQPWGEVKEIRNHYNQLKVALVDPQDRHLVVVFRAFDDGIGFRYEFPEQNGLEDFEITDELTQFVFTDNHTVWWIPAYRDNRYEYLYSENTLSFLLKPTIRAVHTPLTIKTVDGLFLSIHEAALTDYSSMTLVPQEDYTLECDLVPWSDGVKVKVSAPHTSPWRTIQIAERPGDLITSYLILNLNEPNQLEDISWIQPGKYIGIWWAMHIDKWTWGSGSLHGATTEHTKEYIDFAAKYGFKGVLVEGWNRGWDGDWSRNGNYFSFTKPYGDFDLEEVTRYAAEKGTRLIGHNETAASVTNYERQMEEAFSLYQQLGINTIKTGYVGWGQTIASLDENGAFAGYEWHHGQYMIRHYRKVVQTAAKYGILVDAHEPIKDTGIRRTYPNMMTREGARGQEYNGWDPDGGNPPEHTVLLPFTRMLAGPMDFTPGIFDILRDETAIARVNTTLMKQLALYVVLYSPLQMAADLPENYEGHPAFQFIIDVPVDWETTQVPHGEIGEYITLVRKDRHSPDWYIGSITNRDERDLKLPLDFLDENTSYVIQIYEDGPNADWESNPLDFEISTWSVNQDTILDIHLAPGGGYAARIYPKTDAENHLPEYSNN